jgi:hypothetical protein
MTELSPAQKALSAFNERHELCGPFDDDWAVDDDWAEQCLAAALEAVADQVVPKEWPTIEDYNEYEQGFAAAHIKHRNEILAIAAELRGNTTSTETP